MKNNNTDLGHQMTDEELAKLERRIYRLYRKSLREMQVKVDAYFDNFRKRDEVEKRRLDEGKITKQEYDQWRLAQMGRGERFEALRDELSERMLKANEAAAAYINDTTPGIYSLNQNYAAYTIEQVSGNVGFTLQDEQTVRRLFVEQPDILPKRRVNAPVDLKWNRTRCGAEITSGILQGESIRQLAKRVENLSDANYKGAVRNARTAFTGAQNAGRQASYDRAKEMGLPLRKRWIATKDERTRDSHRDLDGQIVELDQPFKVAGTTIRFPGDPTARPNLVWNCRCTMRTVEKEGIEAEPRQMRVVDPETGDYVMINEMTYREWEEWKRSRMPEYLVEDAPGVKNATEARKNIEKAMQIIPETVRAKIEEGTTFRIGEYTDSKYDKRNDIIHVAEKTEVMDIVHEMGHLVEYKMVDMSKLFHVIKNAVVDVGIWDIQNEEFFDADGNPVEVFTIKRDKFISPYQGRVYIDDPLDAFDIDDQFQFKYYRMLEITAEGFREYIENPNNLKQKWPELYNFIEETIK
ncbi:MAG: minor capsid protein [Firmicutes bacterium]|nr:minor capsid protein [Bacillota bacterium]